MYVVSLTRCAAGEIPQGRPRNRRRPGPDGLYVRHDSPYLSYMSAIELSSLKKSFSGVRALDSVDLVVPEGALYGIIGPNGSGKTTLINCLSGTIRPDGGTIRIIDTDVTRSRGHAIARRGVRRTFQHGRVAPDLTVYENVLVGTHNAVLSRTEREERIKWACITAGIDSILHRRAADLVWAERQRVQLARAISGMPGVLLLDEPTAGLGSRESLAVVKILRDLQQRGVTILMVSHDVQVLLAVSDRISVLDRGRVIATGDADQIRGSERVREAYLGAS